MNVPERISHYQILKEISCGGMGAVYEAVDENLDRKVALKITRASDRYDGSALAEVRNRLRLEARLLSRLDHPNLVRVYAFEQVGDFELFSMELIEGETLKDRLNRDGAWAPTQAVALIIRLADVVSAIHGAGVIHLDLKPENIILTPQGDPRIIDFGIAHVRDAMDSAPGAGRLAGTPNYMAPEQILGVEPVPATDVFAMGAILYELLSGERAFDDGSPNLVIQQVLNESPRLIADREQGRRTFGKLYYFLSDCLASNPTERPPDAAAFLDRLHQDLIVPPLGDPDLATTNEPSPKPTVESDLDPTGPVSASTSRQVSARHLLVFFVALAFVGISVWGSQGWPVTPYSFGQPASKGGGGDRTPGLSPTIDEEPSSDPIDTADEDRLATLSEEEPELEEPNPDSPSEISPLIPTPPVDWSSSGTSTPPPAGAVGLFTDPPGAVVRPIRGEGELSSSVTPLWVTVPFGGELLVELRIDGFKVDTQRIVRGVPKFVKLKETGYYPDS